MKLISLSKFVMKQYEFYNQDLITAETYANRVKNYALFLNKPLKNDMFSETQSDCLFSNVKFLIKNKTYTPCKGVIYLTEDVNAVFGLHLKCHFKNSIEKISVHLYPTLEILTRKEFSKQLTLTKNATKLFL